MEKSFLFLVFYSLVLLTTSCKVQKKENIPLREKDPNNPYTACELIEIAFENKIGKIQPYKEYYLRCSMQDYFIKLCESSVKSDELKPFLNKGITVEMEIREGLWDKCNSDFEQVQSRTGKYVVIKRIIK
ncbi:MAG: hypothetical protein HND27_02435 [Bacteroidetes bacterium]|nr:hypothetical protein [Bacteroidota bacterium]MBV6460893.1 hypothetical protein [Flavobacteriales bacterium]WKZ75708.1 MAG: hypothetical protein QY303_02200 [Vicingaceae bacterium]MCL4815275.1 hypothetical protein [Flavobacteriales bacterium]NOG94617.1 hypothetical protein [Bacteroidota bacterium]